MARAGFGGTENTLRDGKQRTGARVAGMLLAVLLFAAGSGSVPLASEPGAEPIEPLPQSVRENPLRVSLGERLFQDARLSHDHHQSCASCHPLDRGGMDGRLRARPTDGATVLRNTPTVFNVAFDLFLNWDGSSEALPAHDERVLRSAALMATNWEEVLPRLHADADYQERFARAYAEGLTARSVLDALASFERSLITPNAPFDRFLRGDRSALSPAQLQGYQLFKSYGCIACHQGINVGGNLVQKFGVFEDTLRGRRPGDPVDLGRYAVTHDPLDREVFRVPSLRNVAVTAPYFHDGRAATLELAVDTMARVQLGRRVSAEEISLIVAFLQSLTGEYRGVRVATDRAGSAP